MIRIANALGLDAYVLGNHDFDYGADALAHAMALARFPVLAANLVDRATGRRPSYCRPFAVLERAGLRIGILGLVSGFTAVYEKQAQERFLFEDPVATARALAPQLRAEHGCHVVLALAHCGMDVTPALAKAVPSLDAVLDSHTHHLTAQPLPGGPTNFVVHAGYHGSHCGHLRLWYDRVVRRVRLADWHAVPLAAAAFPGRGPVAETVREVADSVRAQMGQPVAPMAAPVPNLNWGIQNPVGCLAADAFLWSVRDHLRQTRKDLQAHMACVINGGLRADLKARGGTTTFRDVFEVLPFDNTLCLIEMPGRDVRAMIEVGLLGDFSTRSRQKWCVQVAGLSYVYDSRRPAGRRIVDIRTSEGALADERLYGVVVDGFLADGGGNLLDPSRLTRCRRVDTGILNRDSLAAYLKAHAGQPRLATFEDGRLRNAAFEGTSE